MKRILSIAALLCAVSIAWGQNTKKMNSIKRSAQYIYAEATMETTKEAFEVANDLLLIQVKEYAASKKAFRDNDILVRNIQSQQDSLQIRRGPMVKVFLYVKKSDVLNVDNVVLVDNTSSGKNDEEAVTVNVKETPTATSANAPAEQDSAEGDTSLRLGTSWATGRDRPVAVSGKLFGGSFHPCPPEGRVQDKENRTYGDLRESGGSLHTGWQEFLCGHGSGARRNEPYRLQVTPEDFRQLQWLR